MDFTKLKQLRKGAGLTQIEAAAKIGVSLMTYRLWEMGGGKPNRENYEKLLKLFEVIPFADE